MLKLLLIRHGESTANLDKKFAGVWDVPLTERGRAQAARTAEFLRGFQVDAVYASDLLRARETAAPAAAIFGLTILPEPRLREIDGGDWEGLSLEARAFAAMQETTRWTTDIGSCRCPGGESVKSVYMRAHAAIEDIYRAHPDGCVAVYSHGTPIRALLSRYQGRGLDGMQALGWTPNASVSLIHLDGGRRDPLISGYAGHLEGLL